ncbi:MAG: site-2 protease family protein [Clostridiales bacterium]|nr:site-2 protease family protein [Clostridiales bacterium]
MINSGLVSTLISYGMLIVCGFIVITIHGFLTALTSSLLGDDIPKRNGMLTLNPVKHFEPIGFILFVIFNSCGWGQPVRTSNYNYKNRKAGAVITALAPVVIGFVYGFAVLKAYPLAYKITGNPYVSSFCYTLGYRAMGFAVFNLIPVYPLNGHKLLTAVLSPNNVLKYNQMEKILQYILVFAVLFGLVGDVINFILLHIAG